MTVHKVETKLIYALSFAAQLGFLVIAPLAGFIWLGAYMDQTFQKAPMFLLTGLFVGLTVTTHETYRLLMPLITKADHKEEKLTKDGQ